MTDQDNEKPVVRLSFLTVKANASGYPQQVPCDPTAEFVEASSFDMLLTQNEEFFRTETRFLALLLVRMGLPASEIEDVIQEVWLDASRHRNQFADSEKFIQPQLHGWLMRVVYHKAADRLRLLRRQACQPLDGVEDELLDDAEAVRARAAEQHEWLEALLMQASMGCPRNVRLMRARYFQGLSIREIAQQFGMTTRAVEGRRRRMLKNLLELVEKKFPV